MVAEPEWDGEEAWVWEGLEFGHQFLPLPWTNGDTYVYAGTDGRQLGVEAEQSNVQ